MEKVYEFIKNLNIKSEYIVVAVSGGPDSMFLLKLLQDSLDKRIVVAHVHHNVRKESDEEALKLREYCDNNNMIFEIFKIESYPDGKFSEESARNIRYDFFDRVIKKYNSDILFTAHHGDDLVETILMRLTRGSSIKGYAGIPLISTQRGYKIARPLLFVTKSEILEELEKTSMWYANDLSNNSMKYKRNRFRKNILPVLKEENPKVNTKFLEFSNKLLMIDNYFKGEVSKIKGEIIKNNIVDLHKLSELEDIIKIYIIEEYLNDIYKDNIVKVNSAHLNIIINSINCGNTRFDLPDNKIGIVEYNNFMIIDNNKNIYDIEFDKVVKLPNGKIIEIDNNTLDGSNYVIHLNSTEIKFPLHVRCKRKGDYMYVKNMDGKKSVSNIFTDSKVSKVLRDTYPIVTDDTGTIIWIPGVKKSNLDRKKSGKYDIILKYH